MRVESIFLIALVVATAWLTTSGAPQAGGNHIAHQGLAGHSHAGGISADLANTLRNNAPKIVYTPFGKGEMQVSYVPGVSEGPNDFVFTASDEGGNPVELKELSVTFTAPPELGIGEIPRQATKNEDGTWSLTTTDLGYPGFWKVSLVAKFGGIGASEGELEVEIRNP